MGKTVIASSEEEGWGLLGGETVDLATTAVLPPGSPSADADHVGCGRGGRPPAPGPRGAAVRRALPAGARAAVGAGWQARLDGARVPVQRANLAGLGVAVPKGEHAVDSSTRPGET